MLLVVAVHDGPPRDNSGNVDTGTAGSGHPVVLAKLLTIGPVAVNRKDFLCNVCDPVEPVIAIVVVVQFEPVTGSNATFGDEVCISVGQLFFRVCRRCPGSTCTLVLMGPWVAYNIAELVDAYRTNIDAVVTWL